METPVIFAALTLIFILFVLWRIYSAHKRTSYERFDPEIAADKAAEQQEYDDYKKSLLSGKKLKATASLDDRGRISSSRRMPEQYQSVSNIQPRDRDTSGPDLITLAVAAHVFTSPSPSVSYSGGGGDYSSGGSSDTGGSYDD